MISLYNMQFPRNIGDYGRLTLDSDANVCRHDIGVAEPGECQLESLGCGGEPHGVGKFRRRVEDWGKGLDNHLCIENCQLWRGGGVGGREGGKEGGGGREERDARREGRRERRKEEQRGEITVEEAEKVKLKK